ncbi:ricin B-like lectin [Mycena floridula]|nr:ricin B-like lectin [Mycena floridula]
MAPAELVQSGQTYKLVNVKSSTVVMDLSGTDNRSIIGYPDQDGPNQKWTMAWTGHSWTFRSVSSGLYLNISGQPADGTKLVAAPEPCQWDIWHDESNHDAYRIFIPGTGFNLDLYNYGDATPGNPITLWYRWKGVHQTWKFVPGTSRSPSIIVAD